MTKQNRSHKEKIEVCISTLLTFCDDKSGYIEKYMLKKLENMEHMKHIKVVFGIAKLKI